MIHVVCTSRGNATLVPNHQIQTKLHTHLHFPLIHAGPGDMVFLEKKLLNLLGKNPQISTSYSLDGKAYSQEKFISVGTIGNTKKRLAWFQQGHMRNWRIQRFRGDSDAHVSYVRLEAQIEALAY